MVRYLALHLPYLPAERARQEMQSKLEATAGGAGPLVLTRPAGGTLRVEYVCPGAAGLGLRPGITLAQAKAMASNVAALTYEPLEDAAALRRLAEWALRFSPVVQAVDPDAIYMDITGCQRLFGNELNIAAAAIDGLRQRGFTARAAVTDTVGAARAIAVCAQRAITLVPPGQATAFLTPLPPAALRIDPKTCQRFEELGIRSIGDLLMLPYSTLPSRFGDELVLRLQQALGDAFEGVAPLTPRETPVARIRFDEPLTDVPMILQVADDLLKEMFAAVLNANRALRQLECLLVHSVLPEMDLFPHERSRLRQQVISIGLARASRSPEHVARLLRERLEQVDFTAGVLAVTIIAAQTSHWHAGQCELFDAHPPADDEAFAGLVDRLAARLGHAALVRPLLVDDYQPEFAMRYVEVREAGLESSRSSPKTRGAAGLTPDLIAAERMMRSMPRPVRLLERPIPIRVTALVPDGPPTWFYFDGREYSVAGAAGPERIETGWWRGPDVRRDYFQVQTVSGEKFWIFRALRADNWFVHGVFA